jgi:hypothetical protein
MKNTLVAIIFAITVSAIAFGDAGGRQTADEEYIRTVKRHRRLALKSG